MVQPTGIEPTSMSLQDTAITISAKVANLVEVDGNAPRALTSLPLGTVLQTAVVGNFRYTLHAIRQPGIPSPEKCIIKHFSWMNPHVSFRIESAL